MITNEKVPRKARELPIYGQHPNGCGLASLLMLLNLPQNAAYSNFMVEAWDALKGLYKKFGYSKPEYKYAVVLQYILLKAVGFAEKEELYNFFNSRLEYIYEDQRIMNKFTQEQFYQDLLLKKKLDEAYTFLHYTEDHDFITPYILTNNLYTMKTDIELKILAEMFDYEFLYQDAEDYTGAIYFSAEEIGRKKIAETKRKWAILESHAKDPDCVILYGQYHHWLATRGVYREITPNSDCPESQDERSDATREQPNIGKGSEAKHGSDKKYEDILRRIGSFLDSGTDGWNGCLMVIDCNDPASEERVRIAFNRLNNSDRFYVFRKRKNVSFSILPMMLSYIKEDIQTEMKIWREYIKKRRSAAASDSMNGSRAANGEMAADLRQTPSPHPSEGDSSHKERVDAPLEISK